MPSEALAPIIQSLPEGVEHVGLPTPFPIGTVNAYLLLGHPLTLVDPGMLYSDTTERLGAALTRHGHTVSDVEQIVVTHGHPDHYGAAGWLAARSDAVVVAGRRPVPLPRRVKGQPLHFDQYNRDLAASMTTSDRYLGGLPDYLGVRTVEVGPGTMTAELDVRAELLNPFGTLHGGVITALADHVLGAVLYPVIPTGSWAATTQLNLNFTARVSEGTLTARAVIISLTKRTAVVRIDIHNQDRLAGAAQGTVTIAAAAGQPSEGERS